MRVSGGILLYRHVPGGLQVLLAHPGGPYFKDRDEGHWTIPKGEPDPGEALLDAAVREFVEETGLPLPEGRQLELGSITQKGGKVVHAWAVAGDLDPGMAHSNVFEVEWPPRSGRMQTFPEIDRVGWFDTDEARRRLKEAQIPLIDRLEATLAAARNQAESAQDARADSSGRSG
jgi:predicted NUDIX family NTP pyrophosphohydrolase